MRRYTEPIEELDETDRCVVYTDHEGTYYPVYFADVLDYIEENYKGSITITEEQAWRLLKIAYDKAGAEFQCISDRPSYYISSVVYEYIEEGLHEDYVGEPQVTEEEE